MTSDTKPEEIDTQTVNISHEKLELLLDLSGAGIGDDSCLQTPRIIVEFDSGRTMELMAFEGSIEVREVEDDE